jgi:pimeloyl-ACP methyl ester carboxylesterase
MTGDSTKPPLLLLHGWPGSFIEFEDPIAPLVTSIDPQIEAII